MGSTSQEAEDESLAEQSDVRFIPPLYEQRYQEITRISRECKPKKVVDVGCGELKVIRLLKFHRYIHELIGLDVDGELLRRHSGLIEPLAASYIHPLPHPMVIALLHGSIAERDSRLLNPDLVVCVEVIEHLYPENLSKGTEVIFGYMKPTKAVFTTPNAEFNVLFPGLKGFRHDDHKFEWTRSEFQEWGNAICSDYGYEVEYSGLGAGPVGSEHLGFCTQVAIFNRVSCDQGSPVEPVDEDLQPMPYEEVARALYPSKQLNDEDIVGEVGLRIRQLLKDAQRMLDDEEGVFDNASGDEEDDDALRIWMEKSLASRKRERLKGSERHNDEGGGLELCTERQDSISRTREEGCSDSITSAMDEISDTLQSTNMCHSSIILDNVGHDSKAEENPCDPACQKSQDACVDGESDLPNCRLNLRDVEPKVQLIENDSYSEQSGSIHHSVDRPMKHEVQDIGRTASDDISTLDVLDFEECAYVLGRLSKAFSPTEVEDGNSFFEQWEKGFPPREFIYDLDELKIRISLERLMKFPGLQEMCQNTSKLRDVLLASGKYEFSSDGGAVISDLYENMSSSDSEKWQAASSEGWDLDAHSVGSQDGTEDEKPLAVEDIMEEKECWD
nr:small RNA 2'-O-methyltransferase-like [Lytechinus pictus]